MKPDKMKKDIYRIIAFLAVFINAFSWYVVLNDASRNNIIMASVTSISSVALFFAAKLFDRLMDTPFVLRISAKIKAVVYKPFYWLDRQLRLKRVGRYVESDEEWQRRNRHANTFRRTDLYGKKLPAKYYLGSALSGIVMFGVFIALVLGISAVLKDKVEASPHEVYGLIEEKGYEPQYITQNYYERDPSFKSSLTCCVAFEKDGIHFEFFELNDPNRSFHIYRQECDILREKLDLSENYDSNISVSNYSRFSYSNNGLYAIAVWVGKTTAFAYCRYEDRALIRSIFEEIDYLEY